MNAGIGVYQQQTRSCPSDDRWASFALGDLSARDQEEMIDHLTHCDACQVRLERANGQRDMAEELAQLMTSGKPADPDRPLADGERFGPFRICGAPIGHGGFGTVYKAEDWTNQGRIVALKILSNSPRGMDTAPAGFAIVQQSPKTMELDHPHIIRTYDVSSIDGRSYIVTEFCAGHSLGEWLKAKPRPMPPAQASGLVEQIASAVDYMHSKGIVHCDIKPSNILLEPAYRNGSGVPGFPFIAKLTDFGLARTIREERRGNDKTVIAGTPEYMAPEQIAGEPLGVGVDVFALGVLLYELLTGVTPFKGRTRAETLDRIRNDTRFSSPGMPAELELICHRCLEKKPAHRYDSARAVANNLRRYLDHKKPFVLIMDLDRYRTSRRKTTLLEDLAARWSSSRAAYCSRLLGGVLKRLWERLRGLSSRPCLPRLESSSMFSMDITSDVFSLSSCGF
jgi:eukaryotic-like serine/threonine-protein kinase